MKSAFTMFLIVLAGAGSKSCEEKCSYYDDVQFRNGIPISYTMAEFSYREPPDALLKMSLTSMNPGNRVVMLSGAWYDFFADASEEGGWLKRYGKRYPSSFMIHVINPETDQGRLVWKGNWEEFQQFGIPYPVEYDENSLSVQVGSKMFQFIGIPSAGEIDWCNPPVSLEVKITDEGGEQKSIFLPLGF